ncbi:unnamed protein product (macronuclear) [Paramecium tetraurelia]|uniref:Actin, putative n=1 Tax=Paramecium tetraurelia TaxID=5888 RepID=Q6BG23_PARTE|nr:Actin [Paramecium tetraurelia strain d4-2]XP_001423284.1 uncharacterized protein GSPATT00000321001 [Paramecium tetraurelia]CAH03397.1 Actin, putative [Paramecium tetraurelia]CAK55886.1 unnamed protein product [Paramecium tetraurelia]|eukprot:XP_001423284.1 hypothetical protein (macronuclear) [Paramecium tetraurelia strain d4-2]
MFFPQSCSKNEIDQIQEDYIIKYPILNSKIVDFDTMETVWHKAFFEYLMTNPEDSSILITSQLNTSKNEKEKTTQIMFETFNISKFIIQIQSILSLFSSGKTTGFVVDSGNDTTYFVPIYEGYKLDIKDNFCNIAGKSCSTYLNHLITQSNQKRVGNLEILDYIKEKYCYITLDKEQELQKQQQNLIQAISYDLPDGSHLKLDIQIFLAPEIMFNPKLYDNSSIFGFHQLALNSIGQCDSDLRIQLLKHTMISGGNSLIRGFSERFHYEFSKINNYRYSQQLNFIKSEKFSVWIGGCIMTNLAQISSDWISRNDYDEYGPNIVQRKCF